MKIAFITQPWDEVMPIVGGRSSIPILTYQLAHRLARAGNEIIIYGKKGYNQPDVERDEEGLEYRRIPVSVEDKLLKPFKVLDRLPHFRNPKRPFFASNIYYFGYVWQIARDLQKRQPDIIHIHNFSQFVPIIRTFNRQAKIVLHMHCEWLSQLEPRVVDGRLAKTDLIVGCSTHITERVRERFPHYMDRCQTVFNGVDVERFVSDGAEGVTGSTERKRILFTGRISPEKGIHILLEAFRRVVEQYPEVQLELAGSPGSAPFEFLVSLSDDRRVTELAKFYGNGLKTGVNGYLPYLQSQIPEELAERISFLGFIPHSRLIEHYRQADILVNPSLSEAFGMSLVEAMALGKPVIAARVGGMTTIVKDGETGMLVEAGNSNELAEAILCLLSNEKLGESMGKAGRERVLELFTWDKVIQCLGHHYRSLFKSGD